MANPLLEQAVAYIKAGDTEKGKQLLVNVIKQNPRDENAWLWMSRCVTTVEQKRDCFERVLKINPQNQHAIEGLRRLTNPNLPKPQPKTTVGPKSTHAKGCKTPLIIIGLIAVSIAVCICGLPSIGLLFDSLNPSQPKVTNTSLPPLKALSSLALNKSELESALQTITPLESVSSQNLCNSLDSIGCYNSNFMSNDGDVFVLLLGSYSSSDDAFHFGIARQVQLKTEKHANDIDIPTTVGNHRWLIVSFIGGEPVYYGGADQGVVAIHMIWSRSGVLISETEAIQVFSRLLDAQIAKIRRN